MPANHNTDAELQEIATQGLRSEIRESAHRELDAIDATTRKRPEPRTPAEARGQTAVKDRDPNSKWISSWEPRRPSAGYFPTPAGKRR